MLLMFWKNKIGVYHNFITLIPQEILNTFNILDIFCLAIPSLKETWIFYQCFLSRSIFASIHFHPLQLTLLYANTVNMTCSFVPFRALLWIFLVNIKLILTWNYVHMLEIIHNKAIFVLSENALDIRILLWRWTDNYTAENITLEFFLLLL